MPDESVKNEQVADVQNSEQPMQEQPQEDYASLEDLNEPTPETDESDAPKEPEGADEGAERADSVNDNKEYNDVQDYDTTSVETPEVAEQEDRDYDKDRIAASARRKAEQEARELKSRQDAFAKDLGYEDFETLLQANEKQKYIDQGYDEAMAQKMIDMDRMMAKLKAQERETNIIKEKEKLKSKKFFKEIEPDLDEMIKQSPETPVEVAYKFLVGEKIEELMSNASAVSKQKELNKLNNKNHIKPEKAGTNVETMQIDEEEWRIYKTLNRNATRDEWAKFIKSQK